jgi:hypothetical protein
MKGFFWRQGLTNSLSRPSSNCDSPDRCLLSSEDYRREPTTSGKITSSWKNLIPCYQLSSPEYEPLNTRHPGLNSGNRTLTYLWSKAFSDITHFSYFSRISFSILARQVSWQQKIFNLFWESLYFSFTFGG